MKKYTLFVLLAVAACGPKKVPQTSTRSDINRYQEDLSTMRPTYAVAASPVESTVEKKTEKPRTPTTGILGKGSVEVTKKLDILLDSVAVKNKAIRYAQGYRIQIYSGNDRKEAESAKTASYQLFPDIKAYLIYAQPVYRVKVGDFLDRVEAEKYYVGFKTNYPSAIVVPDKVDIRQNASSN